VSVGVGTGVAVGSGVEAGAGVLVGAGAGRISGDCLGNASRFGQHGA